MTITGVEAGGIGQPVRRKEDPRLLTGKGRYTDDVNLDGQAYAVIARSPHAHARIVSIDASRALAVPGVVAVLTGVDLEADGIASIPCYSAIAGLVDAPLENPTDRRNGPRRCPCSRLARPGSSEMRLPR